MSNTIDVFTEIEAHTGAVVPSELTAQIRQETDVFAEITVPDTKENQMEARYFLYGAGLSDVSTEVAPRAIGENTIEAAFYTRALSNNDIHSEIETIHRGISDVYAQIQPMGYVQIEAEIEVRPHTNMTAIYETMKPPILTMSEFPKHDAFTKKEAAFQTINYGKTATMVIGNNDEFESFVSFKTDLLDSRYVITDVKLELTYLGEILDGHNINLHTADREWNEEGVTYRNRPPKRELVTNEYEIDRDRRVISFDVTDTATRWLSGEEENYGFVLSSMNEEPVYFRTQNASPSVYPRLIVKYYDSVVPSVGRSNVRTEIFIAYQDSSDIRSEIEVFSTYSFELKPAELYIHRYDTPVESEIFAEITAHNPDVTSEITAALRDQDEVLAVVYARSEEQIQDKRTVMHVTRDFVITEVTARQYDETAIESDILVSRNFALTELSVSVEDMSEIFVEIEANDIHVDYKETEIAVRAIGHSDVFVEIEPNIKSDVPAEIDVVYRGNEDVVTEISPRVIGTNEVFVEIDPVFSSKQEAAISVNRPDVLVEIKAVMRDDSDVFVEITPRVIDHSSVESTLAVNRKEILTEMGVRAFAVSETEAELTVRHTKHDEVSAEISIKRDTVGVEITPRAFIHSDALVEITAQQHDDSDKEVEIYVPYASDVPTVIEVIGASNKETELVVSRQTVKAEIMVPFHDDADISVEIRPRVLFASDVYCEITMGKVPKGYVFIL